MSNDWQIKKLGDVCEVIAGQSPVSKYYNSNGDGLPFYQGKKEFTDKFIGEPTTWTTQVTKEAYEGDILMSVRAPVGPTNFATQHICIGRGLAAIRANNEVDKDYLFYFLQSFEDQIIGHHGAVFNSINKKQIIDIKLPLPPLSEQKRIVQILDDAFNKLEIAKNNTEKNLTNAQELFESYLKNIFSNFNDEWELKKIKEISTKIGSGATPKGGKNSYQKQGISLIRSLNIYDEGFKRKNLAFINQDQADRLTNVTIEKNDVLLNITGASIARCCVVPDGILPARVNQHVSIIRANEEIILSKFLHFLLISPPYKSLLLSIGNKGGATRQALTKTKIENFLVRVPSKLDDQKKIIKKIEIIFMKTNKIKEIFKIKTKSLEELKKSLLQKAFSGEL